MTSRAYPHPNVPWVDWAQTPQGPWVRCTQCVVGGILAPGQTIDGFAAAHSRCRQPEPTHLGLGDVVARATGALGVKPCAPCKERQAALNRLMPRVWRR